MKEIKVNEWGLTEKTFNPDGTIKSIGFHGDFKYVEEFDSEQSVILPKI